MRHIVQNGACTLLNPHFSVCFFCFGVNSNCPLIHIEIPRRMIIDKRKKHPGKKGVLKKYYFALH